jgi:hypothetical protein
LTFLIAAENKPDAASLLGTVVVDVDGSPVDAVLVEPASPPAELPELAAEVSCEPDRAVSLDAVSPAAVEPAAVEPAAVEPAAVALLPVSSAALLSAPELPDPVPEAEDPGVGSDNVVPPKVMGAPPGVKVVEPKTISDFEFSLNVAEPTTMTDVGG